ncbi:LLM class flavin-dependent oxidoreductase [Nocardia sp. CDC159]|uniref:LLM class flavin-dependent oxidoreductase n=1 Tax=Nocardia pulmonis TaxID=2951408 RepID=A0A9X2E1Y9_9NOCA|nr:MULTISPECIES: LLM class flavin-dependent oxidoreductase [Nocardia]MCM6772100.1 LLM class flavin-dependent oxidoreductase [Nocardia pulmonis]MCM6785242.1 LLM class flavin-dependent oxidoreductase [Nocardia sp. CDC159]
MIDVPLSVLDLAPVQFGNSVGEGLRATTESARQAERLGYTRFWVAEHHNMPGIASSAPAVLLAHLAAATSTIRIGSGGVMLPNHAPLVVAEQFGTLHALHPGRVDLGIGRAPGTDQATALALRRTTEGLSAESFPQELMALIRYFDGDSADGIVAVPGIGEQPEIWLLGSSGFSAQLAALLGLRFAFAHHFSAENTEAALALYRENFRPSPRLERPHAMIAVSAVCADTDEQADLLARPSELAFLQLRLGRRGPLPTPEQTANFPGTEAERRFVAERREGQLLGSPATVRRQLEDLLRRTAADEVMLNTRIYDIDERVRSLELIMDKVVN